jgi:hypothetical protein
MFKIVTKLLGAIALTGWMGVANATLIFDFSFQFESGLETRGEIRFLGNSDLLQSATSVTLTRAFGYDVAIIVHRYQIDYFGEHCVGVCTVFENEFIVKDDKVMSYAFSAKVVSRPPHNSPYATLFMQNNGYGGTIYYDWLGNPTGGSQVSFSKREVTVPEPGTVILLSLGLAGLSFARYRRQS